jgi:hypothetical protein
MFWKKKNTVEFDGLPVVLSKREAFIDGFLGRTVTKRFLAYKQGDEWRGLVGYEEYKEKTDKLSKASDDIERKLDMILDHLKLQYIPETEKKEPAKLVDKKQYTGIEFIASGGGWIVADNTP